MLLFIYQRPNLDLKLSNFEKLKLNFPILLFNALGAFGDTVGFPVGLGCPLIPTLDVLC